MQKSDCKDKWKRTNRQKRVGQKTFIFTNLNEITCF